MSLRDDDTTLHEMHDHVVEALELVDPLTRDDIDTQRVVYLALLQPRQIIGEAGTWLSEETRDTHPQVPWREIIAFRNRLIHGYDTIDRDILWAIPTSDFPSLRTELETVFDQEADD